jgi:hypothetical protein
MQVCLQASRWSSAIQFRAVALWTLAVALGITALHSRSQRRGHDVWILPRGVFSGGRGQVADGSSGRRQWQTTTEGEGLMTQLSGRMSGESPRFVGLDTQQSEQLLVGSCPFASLDMQLPRGVSAGPACSAGLEVQLPEPQLAASPRSASLGMQFPEPLSARSARLVGTDTQLPDPELLDACLPDQDPC